MKGKKPLYISVCKDAWRFTWHHPLLWLFGLFAVAVGHTGVLEIIGSLTDKISGNVLSAAVPASPVTSIIIPTVFGSKLLGSLGNGLLAIVGLGLAILIIVAAVGSTGALIHAAKRFKRKKGEPLKTSWHHGIIHFWPVFWVNVLKKLSLVILVWVVGIPLVSLIADGYTSAQALLFIVLFLVAIAAGLVISFLANFASMYVVLEDEHIGRALVDAWKLFWKNGLVSFEMALLILFIELIVYAIALAGYSILFIPYGFFTATAQALDLKALWIIGLLLSKVFGALFILWIGSVFSTFSISAWTILYTRLRSPKEKITSVTRRLLRLTFGK